MSLRNKRFKFTGLLATCAAATLVASACSSSSKSSQPASTSSGATSAAPAGSTASNSTRGITSSSITIGELADVGGPVPGLFAGAPQGLDAWAAYVNSQGGIDGRKVVIKFVDSALNCTSYTNGIKSLASSSFALVGTYSLVDTCGEQTLKANPELTDLEGAILEPALDSYSNVFAPIATQPGDATTVYQWVKDKFGAAAVQKAASLWGASAQFDYFEQANAMRSIGYNIIYNRGFNDLETNFTADILRMKNDGVEVVDETDNNVGDLADFLNQAAQQNFHPLAVISGTAYDPTFFKLLGSPSDAKNVVIYLGSSMYLGEDAANVPEINTLTHWLQQTHPGAAMNIFSVDAFSAGLLFQQAMETLGSKPTRAGLQSAIRGITSFNAHGLLPNENPGGKVPAPCDVIVTTQGTKFVRTDPPNSGFLCNGTWVPYTGSGSS